MGIEITVDPRTKKKMVLANGVVSAVYLNELKTVKTYAGQKGQEWTPTHSVAIVVDGVKVSLGLTDKEKVSAKDADGNWHDVVKGVEVSVEVEEGEPYQGKPQYKAFSKDIIVIDASGAQAPAPAKSNDSAGGAPKTPYKAKDNTGVLQGHALKGGAMLVARGLYEAGDLVKAANVFHDITKAVKAWYNSNNEGLDEFSIGNGAGNAVNTAAQYVDTIEEIETEAIRILTEVLPQVTAHIKDEPKPVAAKTARKTAVKTASKKNTAPVDDDDAFDDSGDNTPAEPSNFADMDDDVPFN